MNKKSQQEQTSNADLKHSWKLWRIFWTKTPTTNHRLLSGGKTKFMTPVPTPVPRSDLPDILSSHIDKSQRSKHEPLPSPELNSYGGKSRTINPKTTTSTSLIRPPEVFRSFKAPAPTPAPRPPCHSYHGAISSQKVASRALSPDHTKPRRSNSMFRPQGITVQFSGRGANESRRDALRKLGLLKDS